MINFNKPYDRNDFIQFLEHDFLPDDFQIRESSVTISDFSVRYATAATCLGVCPSLDLEVYEISHSSNYDSRVGTAQDAFQLLLNKSYKNRALVVFVPEGSKQYRFSLLQIEALQSDQSARITRSYSNPRRYSFLLGEGAHVKTPEQFLLEKGRIKIKDGDYFNDLQERFSVETLTRQFYKELSDWYFWAVKNVSFPNDINDENDNSKYNTENVIRLITRLIFVWFLRQKELVKPDFFDTDKLSNLLKDFDAQSVTQHNYYRAILQNLFFATLNQETGKRRFAEDKGFLENRSTNTIKNYYRYENEFKVSTDEVINYFSQIPFLNGGLFECLDAKIKEDKIYYWDGFSRNPKRQARVANELFFAETKVVDLSSEYNDNRMKAVKVSGIIEILKRYNFTVEENTPIDVVVALDPELLGKVFENLLGAYNPETQETARKQTGSFYTPREIVSYMVNESLIAYLKTNVPEMEEDTLRQLLSYESNSVEISETQSENLIQALFKCKILDPACGSGAFPMGILQQMVHVLGKLDPENTYWNKVVMDDALAAFDNAGELSDDDKTQIQEEIESTFDDNINHPNYARKLYLIENCIYGVDIQSIAVQISKLRFFISLICEQTHGDDAANNFGIRPLPNLETKFVAANTLIGIEKNEEDMLLFKQDKILKMITRLEQLRHRQFLVTNAGQKKSLREADEALRKEIVTEVQKMYIKKADDDIFRLKMQLRQLEKELELLNNKPDIVEKNVQFGLFGEDSESTLKVSENKRKELKSRITLLNNQIKEGSNYSRLDAVVKLARQLTSWDPYDQNASSPFFDPEWMFGIKEGFDVVIGNPPYISGKSGLFSVDEKNYYNSHYTVAEYQLDTYILFTEKGINICERSGILSFIIPNTWLANLKLTKIRKYLLDNTSIKDIVINPSNVFETAVVDTIILIATTKRTDNNVIKIGKFENFNYYFKIGINQNSFYFNDKYIFDVQANFSYRNTLLKIELNSIPIKDICIINRGVHAYRKDGYGKSKFSDGFQTERDYYERSYHSETKIDNTYFKEVRGKNIFPYKFEHSKNYVSWGNWLAEPREWIYFTGERIYLRKIIGKTLFASYVIDDNVADQSVYIAKVTDNLFLTKYILAILNSKMLAWYFRIKANEFDDLFPQIKVTEFKQLPIKKAKKSFQLKISNIIDLILFSKQENPQSDTSDLEQQIDNLVYRLYDLTYDEVKVVDPDFGLTEEEYAAIKTD